MKENKKLELNPETIANLLHDEEFKKKSLGFFKKKSMEVNSVTELYREVFIFMIVAFCSGPTQEELVTPSKEDIAEFLLNRLK